MPMSKYFICCEKCFETIGKKNTKAARFWMDLCTYQMNNDFPYAMINAPEFPEVRILELMGFVLTTDQKDGVNIKVQGYLENRGQHCFCIEGGCHD